nr:DUF748 domain-containing protein [uncultured Allomuricauda sp.]
MASLNQLIKKRWLVPGIIILVLLLLRLALPYFVKAYVNEVLSGIPGYTGAIEDIDIALYRGAYTIEGLYLIEESAAMDVPMLKIPVADISVEWSALFDGEIVSEIILDRPEYIYLFENQKAVETTTETDDWSKALTDLVPIQINKFKAKQAKIAFVQVTTEPNIDLHIDNLDVTATNLRNVVREDENLPSALSANGVSVGGGSFNLEGKMDLVREIPDLDLTFALEDSDVSALNAFAQHYAKLDFEQGMFNLFGEIVIADGYLQGYMKPILKNAKLLGKEDGFLETLWEGFVGFFKFILKNKSENTLATKVPIEGDLNDVKSKTFPAVLNILKNGWIKAYSEKVDDEVEFKDVKKEN